MSQLDDRLGGAARALHAASEATLVPPVEKSVRLGRGRESLLAIASVVAVVVLVVGLFARMPDDGLRPAGPPSSAPSPAAAPAPLLPNELVLPKGWRISAVDSTMAVIRGNGPVSRVVVWRPTTVLDPQSRHLVPAPYAIAGFFYGHPGLTLTNPGQRHIGGRDLDAATVNTSRGADRCGIARCVALTGGAQPLRLRSGLAVRAFFGTAYGYPYVVLVESSTASLAQALAASEPVLAQLR